MPVRLIRGSLVLISVVVVIAAPAAGQANRANQASLRWYDAYAQATKAVQNRDWATAERLLLQAQASGTKPGPRVYTYGDSYIRYFPDYYLGIVYLNTGRDREAETAFGRVRSQNLIGAKDPEYASLQRQSNEATFNRAMKEAVELTAKGDFTAARTRAEEARATNVDNGKAAKLLQDITVQTANAAQPPPPTTTTPAPVQPPYTQTPPTNVANQPPVSVGSTPNASLPNQGVINPRVTPVLPKASAVNKTPLNPTTGNTFGGQGVIVPPSPTAFRNGLLAFFSGDYNAAIPLLTSAAGQSGANPRAAIFLACAKVGLVLTGGADAATLREARAAFQSADLRRNLSTADRRLISPRVLQQLETY